MIRGRVFRVFGRTWKTEERTLGREEGKMREG
jgi:hypothetical protein